MSVETVRPSRLSGRGWSRLVVVALAVPVLLVTGLTGVGTGTTHVALAAETTAPGTVADTTAPGVGDAADDRDPVQADPVVSDAGTVELEVSGQTTSAYSPGALDGADSSQRVTWSVEPATEQGPDGRVSFRHEVDPGATFTDYVTISNYADREVTFALYASDGLTTSEGVFDLLPGAATPTDAGSWITIDRAEVAVPAQSAVTVPFTVSVPDTATPGDHPAGIVAALTTAGAGDAGAVSMERRVGARLHLRVAGELQPVIVVQNLTADFSGEWGLTEGGSSAVEMDLVNTGNVRLQGNASLEISGPLGVWSRTVDLGAIPEILPRNQIHVVAALDNVPPLIMLTHAVTIELAAVGIDDVGTLPAPTTTDTRSSAMPWLWIVLLLAVVALITYLVQSRSRARRKLAAAVAAARAAGELAGKSGEPDTADSVTRDPDGAVEMVAADGRSSRTGNHQP